MRTLIAASLAALSLAAGCSRSTPKNALAPDDARQLLIDRNWIDRAPETPSDKLHVFRFVPTMGGGVYQDRTLYAGQFELFTYDVSNDEIVFALPHTGESARTRYTIEKLAAPRGTGLAAAREEPQPRDAKPQFDLKLTLEASPRGPSIYYGWTSDKADDLDGTLGGLAAR
jgi:hypothetical protein